MKKEFNVTSLLGKGALPRVCFVLVLVFAGLLAKGQEADSIPEREGRMATDFLLFESGWNYLSPKGGDPSVDYGVFTQRLARSTHFGLGIFRQRVDLYRQRLGLEYGLGLGFDRYEWAGNYRMEPYGAFVAPVADTVDYRRNSLHITSLGVPLLLGFGKGGGKSWRSYRISAGGYMDVLMGAKSKRRAQGGNTPTIKERGSFNLPPIQYGIRFDAEWWRLGLFLKYGLGPYFKPAQDGGYPMRTITAGMRWAFF